MLHAATPSPPRQHQPFVVPADFLLAAPPPPALTRAEWASSPAWVRDRLPAPPLCHQETSAVAQASPAHSTRAQDCDETQIVEYQPPPPTTTKTMTTTTTAALNVASPPRVSSSPSASLTADYSSPSPFSSRLPGYLNQTLSELRSPPVAARARRPPITRSSSTSPSTSVPNLDSLIPSCSRTLLPTRPRLVAPTSDQKLDMALRRLFMAPDLVPHHTGNDIVPHPIQRKPEIIPSPKPVRRPKSGSPPKPRWQNPKGCCSVRRGLDDIPVGGTSPSKVVSKRQTHKTTVDPQMNLPVGTQQPIYDSQLYLAYPTSIRKIKL